MSRQVIVVDASAGVEIVANTARGARLRALIPRGASRDVPEHFFAEAGGVLRRWELGCHLSPDQCAAAFRRLLRWSGERYPVLPLLREAWAYRHNLVVADALYVVLALRLDAGLLTDDFRLANAPNLPGGSSRANAAVVDPLTCSGRRRRVVPFLRRRVRSSRVHRASARKRSRPP